MKRYEIKYLMNNCMTCLMDRHKSHIIDLFLLQAFRSIKFHPQKRLDDIHGDASADMQKRVVLNAAGYTVYAHLDIKLIKSQVEKPRVSLHPVYQSARIEQRAPALPF